ncbi:Bcr/CflA family drug resistance efflux transporter, partial [Vibrio sp. DBSS07]|nr:Bcr/CflA family drug resistance efflux transporter [Vibrio paucivorans]
YHAGTGGAILGGMQNLGAGFATLGASLIPASNQMPLGGLMLIMSILAMIGLRLVNGKQDPSNEMPLAA